MNQFVRKKIRWKNEIYKKYIKNGFTDISNLELRDATNVVAEIIKETDGQEIK